MRNTIAAMAAFSGVMGVGSAWGYGLEATDWVGKGANTLASTGANWNNGVVPSASMRFPEFATWLSLKCVPAQWQQA